MGVYKDLEGKVVLITGGSGDLGSEITLEMARQGCTVYFTYNNSEEKAKETFGKIGSIGGKAKSIACNVTNKTNVEEIIQNIISESNKIDILINNAGIYSDNLFALMSDEEFDTVIKTNLYGTYYCTKAVIRHMIKCRAGVIINMASLAGVTSSFGQSNYSASKGAIVAFGRTLASELAQQKIRLNTIAPGVFDTAMTKRVPRNILNQIVSTTASKRLGKPKELAHLVAFLSSDDSSYICGQTIVIDGGLIMR